MPHRTSDDDKIIICCYDLQAILETLKLTLQSIEAGIQLRATTKKGTDKDAADELIALALTTMQDVEATNEAFHELRDRLFGFDDHD